MPAKNGNNDEFLGASSRVVAHFSAKALLGNFEAILSQVPGQFLLPMVKADGYGHGAAWVAGELAHLPEVYGFGVATLEEGITLRRALGKKSRIVVFSGSSPWTEEKGACCEKFGLTPVISHEHDWEDFFRQGWAERVPYELKFNTGMNRLGIPLSLAPKIGRSLRAAPMIAHPSGVFSHLAIGEDPRAPLSRRQLERFVWLKGELSGLLPRAQFHLANSAAIWGHKEWGLKDLTDGVRPGLSLYGIPPWEGAPERGLEPVLTLRASVVSVHRLKPGESMGYGAQFTVPSKGPQAKPVFAAVLAAGYADGVSRRMSGEVRRNGEIQGGGWVWLGGEARRMLGRVSMDFCAVLASSSTRIGEWAEILGPNVEPWAQARAAGTIPYELLTSVSQRVKRIYE